MVLRDDKRYLVLRLDPREEYPTLELVRKIRKDGALYFGPYVSAQAVRQTLKVLHNTFPLRQCKGNEFRRRQRPCLNYQMGRCLGLCVGGVSREEYARVVEQAVLFLKGRTQDLQARLREEMLQAAESFEYEKAAMYRDRLQAVERTLQKQLAVSSRFRDQDIIGIHESGGHLALAVLFIRGGRMVGSRAFMFRDKEETTPVVLRAFVLQYYGQGREVPEEILISDTVLERELLEEWLTDLRGKRVSIRVPRRGEGRQLLSMASHNAANYLLSHMEKATDPLPALQSLQKRVGLESLPRLLECVDISNFRGQFPVGSVVVFKNGEPDKTAYRRYRIKDVSQIDDTAMMAEVLRRRFSRVEDSHPVPDLLVVDGGKAQLNQALAVLEQLDLVKPVQVVALAKKQKGIGRDQLRAGDRLYLKGRKNPVLLVNDPPVHFLLSRLRDEAHRFAISYYQKRHRTSSLQSGLDEIHGIGPKRRRDLIKSFGSVSRLAKASVDEISRVPGISSKLAEEIFLALQKK